MGRTAFRMLALLGVFGTAVAGTYQPVDFSFLTSESNNYSPLSSYYASVQQPQQQAPSDRPVVRKNRGIGHSHGHTHTTTYTYSSPIYISKSPLYYPESTIFSDPLPIVPLPELPSEFLTLKTGSYVGSENEVPKKTSRGSKKARRGKATTTTTPAPSEEEEEDDVQETEGEEDEISGGYPASGRGRQETEASGGYPASGQGRQESEASGGYPASGQGSQETEAAEGYPASGQGSRQTEASGGYPASGQGRQESEGGYPSNLDANAMSGRSRSQQARRNRNRGKSQGDDEEDAIEDTEADQGDEEIMMLSDDGENVDEEPEEEVRPRGRSRSQKKSRKGKGRSRGGSSSEDEAALDDQRQIIESYYVPTFGNNVLNTVYPAYSQNALLKSLESQEPGYPESEQDVSAISISADGKSKKSRKSKKRTSPRRNRPASRSSSRRSKNRQLSSARAAEPVEQNQAYGPPQFTPGTPLSGRSGAPSAEYGVPSSQLSGRSGAPNAEYGVPSSQLSGRSGASGLLNPPPQSANEGGYRTVNNEMKQQANGFTQSQPSQSYGVPNNANGAQTVALEARQISPARIVAAGNEQLSPVGGANNMETAELIRTVQAILQRYPN